MTANDFEQPAPVSQYGAQRRADWLAGLQANADAMTQAGLAAHQQDHDIVTAGQHGIFGNVTPQQQAADVAAIRRVGDGTSAGRDLVAQGGTFAWADYGCAPAPAPVDMRWVNRPGVRPTGKSSLLRHMEGNE